ncbi:HD domain-containing protein [Deinococcus cellulosilyticus]|nr:HD domain-containing protein [Deinococcus cellulosilyticus]
MSVQPALNLHAWEERFKSHLLAHASFDAGHDLEHIQRVVLSARRIALQENAELNVVLPAAWLHDCVIVPKDSPLRKQASRLAADAAKVFLESGGYPEQHLDAIHHAILTHSFSAGIPPETLEAKIVQDADRLDALGSIGIARCLMLGGSMGRALYHPQDPFGESRMHDDLTYTIDHFFVKLFKLPSQMHTQAAREEAEKRVGVMRQFLEQLGREVG